MGSEIVGQRGSGVTGYRSHGVSESRVAESRGSVVAGQRSRGLACQQSSGLVEQRVSGVTEQRSSFRFRLHEIEILLSRWFITLPFQLGWVTVFIQARNRTTVVFGTGINTDSLQAIALSFNCSFRQLAISDSASSTQQLTKVDDFCNAGCIFGKRSA